MSVAVTFPLGKRDFSFYYRDFTRSNRKLSAEKVLSHLIFVHSCLARRDCYVTLQPLFYEFTSWKPKLYKLRHWFNNCLIFPVDKIGNIGLFAMGNGGRTLPRILMSSPDPGPNPANRDRGRWSTHHRALPPNWKQFRQIHKANHEIALLSIFVCVYKYLTRVLASRLGE